MRKLFLFTLMILASATGAFAQTASTQNGDDIPNMGRAPREPNGIGRLDLRVVDEQGIPSRASAPTSSRTAPTASPASRGTGPTPAASPSCPRSTLAASRSRSRPKGS